jgi:hypothetical protein
MLTHLNHSPLFLLVQVLKPWLSGGKYDLEPPEPLALTFFQCSCKAWKEQSYLTGNLLRDQRKSLNFHFIIKGFSFGHKFYFPSSCSLKFLQVWRVRFHIDKVTIILQICCYGNGKKSTKTDQIFFSQYI